MDSKFKEVVSYFPEKLREVFPKIPEDLQRNASEIRLRSEREVILLIRGKQYSLFQTIKSLQCKNFKLFPQDINEIFKNICSDSVYSFQNQIKNGFITLKGGHRVGLCGTAVLSEHNEMQNIKNISSLNFRIAREFPGCAEGILQSIKNSKKGSLIAGAPGSGKTTFLRDIARGLSEEHTVSIVDERSEIAGVFRGIPQFDIGNSDVLDGYLKPEGILQAVRVMSPEILICDEMGKKKRRR